MREAEKAPGDREQKPLALQDGMTTHPGSGRASFGDVH